MIIDAHQHFWRYTPAEFAWIEAPMRAIRQDYAPADLAPLLSPLGIDGTIAIEARMKVEETIYLLDLARQNPFIKAVVGWAPLSDPDVEAVLENLSVNPQLKGIRHVLQGEADGFMDAASFSYGLREITRRGLNFDLCIRAAQLAETIRLVDRHPQQIFILDHIAKPVVNGPPPAEWTQLIGQLAERENVSCKFSGVVTEVPGWNWTPTLLRPYFEVVLGAFGPDRLLFASDWPVCLVASDYARWFRFVETCVAPLAASERDRILGGTACALYKL